MQFTAPCHKLSTAPYCATPVSIKSKLIDQCHTFMAANTDDSPTGSIVVADRGKITCDSLVLAVLKSLVRVGETPSEELALACRKLFLSILHADSSYITIGAMLKCLSKDTYELTQLSDAIKAVAAEVR